MKDPATTIAPESSAPSQPSFQQLLAAAFIVQEHNDKQKHGSDPDAAYTRTLAEIVETERLIQDPRIDFHTALELLAERTHTITHADGVALGLLENGKLVYRADTGTVAAFNAPALITETLAAECFRTGKALQSSDCRTDDRVDASLCQELGVESLLAIPIRDEGKIAGVLEVRFQKVNGFQSHDLRTCQLMSGLAGEVLGRKAKQGWKQALAASEEEAVRSVLDQMQPELERMEERDEEFEKAVSSLTRQEKSSQEPQSIDLTEYREIRDEETHVLPPVEPVKKNKFSEILCTRCGHAYAANEDFCVVCGAMRSDDAPAVLNAKTPAWTSLWDMQAEKGLDPTEATKPSNGNGFHLPDDSDVEDTVARLSDEPDSEELAESKYLARFQSGEVAPIASEVLVSAPESTPEAPAASSRPEPSAGRHALERVASLWHNHRATVYLAAAVGLLAAVIVAWAVQPSPPPSVTPRTEQAAEQASSAPEMSLTDKLLVNLGLAEAPATPVNRGDPNAKVWVDLHTALYYCSGADLYGKTQGGRYAKQRDAQLDQFQPAGRKACN